MDQAAVLKVTPHKAPAPSFEATDSRHSPSLPQHDGALAESLWEIQPRSDAPHSLRRKGEDVWVNLNHDTGILVSCQLTKKGIIRVRHPARRSMIGGTCVRIGNEKLTIVILSSKQSPLEKKKEKKKASLTG